MAHGMDAMPDLQTNFVPLGEEDEETPILEDAITPNAVLGQKVARWIFSAVGVVVSFVLIQALADQYLHGVNDRITASVGLASVANVSSVQSNVHAGPNRQPDARPASQLATAADPATEPFHWGLEANITAQDRLADGLLALVALYVGSNSTI